MSVIWCPTKSPPDPNSILPWSEEAENIWQQILKKHKLKRKKNAPIDPSKYYNNIYEQTFGSSLADRDVNESRCVRERPTMYSSQQYITQSTSSGYINRIVPLTNSEQNINYLKIFSQQPSTAQLQSQENDQDIWQTVQNSDFIFDKPVSAITDDHNTIMAEISHTNAHIHLKTAHTNNQFLSNTDGVNNKFTQLANCAAPSFCNVGSSSSDERPNSLILEPTFHLDIHGFTQEKERIDASQSLFSQLETQNANRENCINFIDTCSDMSSPPLDLSPDNETFLLLSQKYCGKKQHKSDVRCKKGAEKERTRISNDEEFNISVSEHNILEIDDLLDDCIAKKSYSAETGLNTSNTTLLSKGEPVPMCSIGRRLKELSSLETKEAERSYLTSVIQTETVMANTAAPVEMVNHQNSDNLAVQIRINPDPSESSPMLKQQPSTKTSEQTPKRKIGELKNLTATKNCFTVPLKRSNPSSTAVKENQRTVPGKQLKIDNILPVIQQHKKAVLESPVRNKNSKLCFVDKMSDDEKITLKCCLREAEEVAITLVYEDGSSQLREHVSDKKPRQTADSETTGLAVAYPVTTLKSHKLKFVIFPFNGKEKKSTFDFCRETLGELFASKTRKLCFEAQEAISIIFTVFTFAESNVCNEWNVLDPKVAGWLLNPDHPPVTFKHVLMPYQDLNQEECPDRESELCSDMSLLGPAMLHIYQRLKQQELWTIFTKLEMPLLPILAVMENRGIQVNTSEMLEMCNFLKKKLGSLEQAAHKAAGQPFNVNSHPQLRLILFEKLQLDLHLPKKKVGTTGQGNKSTSEAVLTQLAELHPLPKIVLEHRQLQKLKSTYIDGMMVFVQNSELRTHWDQIAAATGRLTSTNPNIQAMPKQAVEVTDDTEQYIIGKEPKVSQVFARAPFTSQEGWTLLAADFKQIELRTLAHLSSDEKLLKVFKDEKCGDIFIELASQWLDKSVSTVTQQDREQTKRIVYSVMYGAGKDKLAEYLKISSDDAKAIMQSFLLKFPGINSFNKTCIEEARKNRFQVTILKRRRYFPNITHAKQHLRAQAERQAVNFCVQGSAADLCKAAMIQVEHSLQNSDTSHARLLFQIHDELLLEVPDSEVDQTAEIVKTIMESSEGLCGNTVSLKVPLKVSLCTGKSWGHLIEKKS